LIVIAIITILVAILFPVFSQAREKANVGTCQSNCKQFGLAILMYAQDASGAMPIAFKAAYLYGPLTAKIAGVPQQGVHAEISAYIHEEKAFVCPDDRGFELTGPHPDALPRVLKASQGRLVSNRSFQEVYGSSYKFTHENFSNPYTTKSLTGYSIPEGLCTPGGTLSVKITPKSAMGTYTNPDHCGYTGEAVLQLPYFARPAETRMFRCYNPPFHLDDDRIWHGEGTTVAYVDGHVKFVTNTREFASGCDGPTWAWDHPGSCNIHHLQRNAD